MKLHKTNGDLVIKKVITFSKKIKIQDVMMGYSAVNVRHTVPFYGSISYKFENVYNSH